MAWLAIQGDGRKKNLLYAVALLLTVSTECIDEEDRVVKGKDYLDRFAPVISAMVIGVVTDLMILCLPEGSGELVSISSCMLLNWVGIVREEVTHIRRPALSVPRIREVGV